jgi:hypothetical protein
MRRLILVSLLVLAGCQSLIGPRKRAMMPEKVDPPYLPIKEQEYRARDRLAYPDSTPDVGPRTGMELPAQQYGRLSH